MDESNIMQQLQELKLEFNKNVSNLEECIREAEENKTGSPHIATWQEIQDFSQSYSLCDKCISNTERLRIVQYAEKQTFKAISALSLLNETDTALEIIRLSINAIRRNRRDAASAQKEDR